jgi:hypothetical protein
MAALWILLQGVPCRAGIDNTHHDLRLYIPESRDACGICHARKDANDYSALDNDLGRTGGSCIFLCHSGKGILPETDALVPEPGPVVNTTDYSTIREPDFTVVYFTRSHGRNPENLKGAGGNPVPWPPRGVSLPGVSAGSKLECTSCHSIHDGTYPPFLHGPLGANYPNRDGFCDRCHPERATNNLAGPPDGSHPVDFPVNAEAAAGRSGNRRNGRRVVIQKYGKGDSAGRVPVFDVPAPAPPALTEPGVSWSMGGHLSSGADNEMKTWQGKGTGQQMGCYTCHSAHQPHASGERSLAVLKTSDAENGWNPLCTGCHGESVTYGGDADEWNPGVTPYGHPAGRQSSSVDNTGVYRATTGAFTFRVAMPKHVLPQTGNRYGSKGQLLCTTCHKVHHGQTGTLAIADLGQGTVSVCKACHSGVGHPKPVGGVEPPNSHHITFTEEEYRIYVERLGFTNPTWWNAGTGRGDLRTGLDCADCHISETAHNW